MSSTGSVSAGTVTVINTQPLALPSPTLTITQPTCSVSAGTITVTAPIGQGYTYGINGTSYAYQSGTTFSGLAAGSYSLTVTPNSGCTSSTTVAVINPLPAIPATPTVAITQPTNTSSTGTIIVTSPLGTAYAYCINGTTYQSETIFNSVASGSYNVLVRNNSGCVSNAKTAVVNSIAPTAYAGLNQQLTLGTTSTSLSGSGTGAAITFAWTQVSGGNVTITSPASASTTITGLTGGIFIFQLTVTDNSGVKASSNVTVSVGTILTIQGTSTSEPFAPNTSTYDNGISPSKSTPTQFSFLNNYVTSSSTLGYMLQAGWEHDLTTILHQGGCCVGNFDYPLISGNFWNWTGSTGLIAQGSEEGIFAAWDKNSIITYNYLYQVPMSITQKGVVNTGGAVAYNILNNPPYSGVNIKGQQNTNVFNNTFYSNLPSNNGLTGLITIYDYTENGTGGSGAKYTAQGTLIYNNIFYTVRNVPVINIGSTIDQSGFQCDYNIYYCETGTNNEPTFVVNGSSVSWATWRSMGYDAHSVIVNPNFIGASGVITGSNVAPSTFMFVPTAQLYYGTNLGSAWQAGLSGDATWSTSGMPTTANQGSLWQVGARVVSNSNLTTMLAIPVLADLKNDTTVATIIAYPNPYSTEVNFNMKPKASGRGSLAIFDLLGRKLATVFEGDFVEGSEKTVSFRLSVAKRQPLIYILTIGNRMIYGKLFPGDY
jgi:hypothetical protein